MSPKKYGPAGIRKADHLLVSSNEANTRFAECGRVSYESDRLNGRKTPSIIPRVPFMESDDRCCRCYRKTKGIKTKYVRSRR